MASNQPHNLKSGIHTDTQTETHEAQTPAIDVSQHTIDTPCPCGSGLSHTHCQIQGCANKKIISEELDLSNSPVEKDASLDNKTNNCVMEKNTIFEPTPGERVSWNDKYSAKISEKAGQSFKIRQAIANFLDAGAADPQTGEWLQCDLRNISRYEAKQILANTYYEQLYNYYYRLGLNDSLYAEFDNGLGLKSTQIIATKYSMHNFCPVWGFRKSKIIRKRYKDFFGLKPELLQDYHPCHLVLTLKHNEQGFYLHDNLIEKRFFARELIEQFKQMRDNRRVEWKELVFGGCYNIECKKSKSDNGLHVHMHCLILQNKSKTVNEVRSWIKEAWQHQTGATQTHYETLYYWDVIAASELNIVEEVYDIETQSYKYECPIQPDLEEVYDEQTLERIFANPDGEILYKKYYDSTWSVAETTRAILEALKYNFKSDSFVGKDGNIDVPFIAEMLNESKGLRFTSRFNAFYRESILNFNTIGTSEDEAVLEDQNDHLLANYIVGKADEYNLEPDEISMETFNIPGIDYMNLKKEGYTDDFEKFLERFEEVLDIVKQKKARSIFEYTNIEQHYGSLINPFTFEQANYADFHVVLGFPHTIRHRGRHHQEQYKPYHKAHNFYQLAHETTSIKELTRCMMMGQYNAILVYEDQQRFEQSLAQLQQLRPVEHPQTIRQKLANEFVHG